MANIMLPCMLKVLLISASARQIRRVDESSLVIKNVPVCVDVAVDRFNDGSTS